MKYLLDTNICIYLIKKQDKHVLSKFQNLEIGDVGISSVTLSELLYGVYKSEHIQKNHAALNEFISPLEIMPYEEEASLHYGMLRAHLEKRGTLIGQLDLMIAAHAKSLNVILVTNYKREFMRVPELLIENWVRE